MSEREWPLLREELSDEELKPAARDRAYHC
jgi:hypothetical protein